MNNNLLDATVNLINDKVKFQGTAKENPSITIDYVPPLGDGEGYTSLELLLLSLASCSGTAVLSILRKMKKNISGFRVKAQGARREEHPTILTNIKLEFSIESNDADEESVQKAIAMSEASYCPVWAMLKNSTEITAEYRIIDNSK
ncbi:MAG: OsmC family protein [Bacillota bacterium]